MHEITQDDINWCDARTTQIVSGKFGRARDEDELQIGRLAMCEAAKNHDESKSRFYYWAGFYIISYLYRNEYGFDSNGRRSHGDIYKNKGAPPISFDGPHHPILRKNNLEDVLIAKDEIEKALCTTTPTIAKAIVDKEISGVEHDETGAKLGYGKRSLGSMVDQWKKDRNTYSKKLTKQRQQRNWQGCKIDLIDVINSDIDYEYGGK